MKGNEVISDDWMKSDESGFFFSQCAQKNPPLATLIADEFSSSNHQRKPKPKACCNTSYLHSILHHFPSTLMTIISLLYNIILTQFRRCQYMHPAMKVTCYQQPHILETGHGHLLIPSARSPRKYIRTSCEQTAPNRREFASHSSPLISPLFPSASFVSP